MNCGFIFGFKQLNIIFERICSKYIRTLTPTSPCMNISYIPMS